MSSHPAPTTVRLSEKNKSELDKFSSLTKRSRSFIVNAAVEKYLDEQARYLKEVNEAVASIDTQPTYRAEDVFAWMHTWGTEEEKPLDEAAIKPSKSQE